MTNARRRPRARAARHAVPVLLLAAAALPLASGCASINPPSCTEIGCASSVTFRLAGLEAGRPYTVNACVDDYCREVTIEVRPGEWAGSDAAGLLSLDVENDSVTLTLPDDRSWDGQHAAALRLSTEDGASLQHDSTIEFERSQPNGPNCDPTCWVADVEVAGSV